MIQIAIGALFSATVLGGACAVATSPVAPAELRAGTWGGDHVRLDVSASGAQAEFDCAHATIGDPIALDASGHFVANGQLVTEGGPTGRTENARPARFAGSVTGDQLTLNVTLTDSNEDVGTFTLTFGRPANLRKCS
jgi:hypothetical protein